MRHENDFSEVVLPSNASKSRSVDEGVNDPVAQHSGALQLAYSVHGGNCRQCGSAQSENELCDVGYRIYSQMRTAGLV